MRKFEGLEPAKVFYFFEEICNIPHGSYEIDKISDYLAAFAKERNLDYIQDEVKNVIINKPATKGYENEPVVIIQGHMDMVAVKDADCDINMSLDGLNIAHDDEYVWAEGTSLGGDDGIAVAYALAILDSDDIKHPNLQVIITVNEEVGMDGAIGIDPKIIKGNRLLNIDSEEEGIFTVGCAGGTKVESFLPVNKIVRDGCKYSITVDGLQGGHSGTMIHLGRANADVILGRILLALSEKLKADVPDAAWGLGSLKGGEKSNAIPASAYAEMIVVGADKTIDQIIQDTIAEQESILKQEYKGKDDGLQISLKIEEEQKTYEFATKESSEKCIQMLIMQPDGVQSRNAYLDSLVETSLNLGIMNLSLSSENVDDSENNDDSEKNATIGFKTIYELRSSVRSSKNALKDKVRMIAELLGAKIRILGEYPEWEFRNDSRLQKKMIDVYSKMYHSEPEVNIIHAGLECGVLAEKIEGLDAVSFGPNILDIHTTKEKLDIASTKRVWEFLLELLATKDND